MKLNSNLPLRHGDTRKWPTLQAPSHQYEFLSILARRSIQGELYTGERSELPEAKEKKGGERNDKRSSTLAVPSIPMMVVDVIG